MQNMIHRACDPITKPPENINLLPYFVMPAVMAAITLGGWLWLHSTPLLIVCGVFSTLTLATHLDFLISEARKLEPTVIEDAPLEELVESELEEVDTSDPPADEWTERFAKYIRSRAARDPEAALLWLELEPKKAYRSGVFSNWHSPGDHMWVLMHRRSGVVVARYNWKTEEVSDLEHDDFRSWRRGQRVFRTEGLAA